MPTAGSGAVEEAVRVLRSKGVVALPTDTLYGLAADAFCDAAVRRVFEIKGRSVDMGLPILLGNVHDLQVVATDIPDLAWRMVDRFWPGPLTLILRKSPKVSRALTGGSQSVAVRMPNHEVPLTIVRELGRPITGTSANSSGGPDPVTAEDVRKFLGDEVDYILDGGPATRGSPSTIVDLTGPKPRLVRRGVIEHRSLQMVCPFPVEVS